MARVMHGFEVRERIGSGGMSTVYRGVHTTLGYPVAIKVLARELALDQAFVSRFEREAKAACSLKHNNIVSVIDFGSDDDIYFIVMEYVDGQNLAEIFESLQKQGQQPRPLPAEIALILLQEIACGLKAAHDNGIIHRDIKPSNILIGKQGEVKIADFGLARETQDLLRKPMQDLTVSGLVVGTPSYMSPEQAAGRDKLDGRTDIFSLGIVAYQLLTGWKPFVGGTASEILVRIINAAPAPLTPDLCPQSTPALIALVDKMLAKDPGKRFQNMDQVLDALADAIQSVDPTSTAVRRQRGYLSRLAQDPQRFVEEMERKRAPLGDEDGYPGAPSRPLRPPTAAGPAPMEPGVPGLFSRLIRAFRGARSRPVRESSLTLVRCPRGHVFAAALGACPYCQGPGAGEDMLSADETRERGLPSRSPVPSGVPGGLTGVFTVGRETGLGDQTLADKLTPDAEWSLAITNCENPLLIGRQIRIPAFPFRLGRCAGEPPVELDPNLAPEHAEIARVRGGFTIQGLLGSPGTYVEGKRLVPRQPEPLLIGARILLGDNVELTFTSGLVLELPDMSGRLVAGRYTLEKRLSSTAASVVYAATDGRLARAVTIKILSPRLAVFPGYRERFDQEAKIACRLVHPNICRALDYGDVNIAGHGLSLFICTEDLGGGTLASLLEGREPIDLQRMCGWLDKLAAALDFVHEQGVIHGGLRPSAIVFDRHDNPYLTDFALASTAGEKSSLAVVGQPAFLAPEQWDSGVLLPATDQYSLAVIIYLACTGELPFLGQERPDIRRRNFLQGPAPAHDMAAKTGRPPLPAALSSVLRKAMDAEPRARHETLTGFAAAFRGACLRAAARAEGPARVFVSYCRSDSTMLALYMKSRLEGEYGFCVMMDVAKQDTAGPFPERLQREINECDVFVCLLTDQTLRSAWVNREITLACGARKSMIPVFQEGYQRPRDLDGEPEHVRELLLCEGIEVFDRRNKYIDAAIADLSVMISKIVEE